MKSAIGFDTDMLDTLQRTLSDIYDLEPGYDVRDFLITDPTMAKALGQGALLGDSEETLLMLQDGEELSLSLFLDGDMLGRLESGNPLDNLEPIWVMAKMIQRST